MIAVDTNILVYAHRLDSDFHGVAMQAVRSLAEGGEPWAIPWPCVHEFLSVTTNSRIYRQPTPIDNAITQVEIWMESPWLRLVGESAVYWKDLTSILTHGRINGPMVHDARVAAICRSHGVRELWSADRDFSRMSGVKIVNPLVRRGKSK
jgi:toxin-antitoxin system PIN domain toxin